MCAWLQELVEVMCSQHDKPMLFPLSNPTSQAEITAEDAYKWSKGKCIFASGGSLALCLQRFVPIRP